MCNLVASWGFLTLLIASSFPFFIAPKSKENKVIFDWQSLCHPKRWKDVVDFSLLQHEKYPKQLSSHKPFAKVEKTRRVVGSLRSPPLLFRSSAGRNLLLLLNGGVHREQRCSREQISLVSFQRPHKKGWTCSKIQLFLAFVALFEN